MDQSHSEAKQPKARKNASIQHVIGFILNLIGWEGGVSFVDQSLRKVKQTQSNHVLLSTLN